METTPVEYGLVFLSGILGSAHCIGMCGGIAATMNLGTHSMIGAVVRQCCWSLGRTLTYVFLGVTASSLGIRFLKSQGNAVWIQGVFAITAGILLIIQGLHAGGWLAWRLRRRTTAPCVTRSVFSQFFRGGSATGVFIAGLMTGFLPCGLVYSFLALSASSGHVVRGILIMLCFGLGTVPVMMITGAGLSVATINIRRNLLRIAAISVLVTGLMTTVRGVAFARNTTRDSASAACPLCLDESALVISHDAGRGH